jgi:hypothetical protein
MREYLKSAIEVAATEPGRAARLGLLELNYVGRRANQFVHGRLTRPDGYRLMERDWDTAIVLDACRYDTFEAAYDPDLGELSKETAPGSESREFFQRTFQGRTFHDTVYVTGNPYITILEPDTFHAVNLDDAWNETGTEAPPERITEAALEAHETYPNKRVIVHYMTPHRPFVAPGTRHVDEAVGSWRGMFWPERTSREAVRTAYRRNLDHVLEHVEELLDAVDGKVVVTADHGELLGERIGPVPTRCYGHHPSLYVPELVEVPWLEVASETRRPVEAEPPAEELSVEEEAKTKRLRALGYVE